MNVEDGAPVRAQRVVLFDFDGVLVHGDTFNLFLRERYARGRWRYGVMLLSVPWLLVVLPFSRRRVLRWIVRVGLLGLDTTHYRELADAFADALVHRPRQFVRDGLRELRRHVAAGDRVLIVTGCEEMLAHGVLAGLGVDGVEVLASRLCAARWGLRTEWHNLGRCKVELLAEHGIDAWQVAYSDSSHDLPMLAPAAQPVLVNATPKLCKRIEKALARSVTRVEWY